MATLTKSQYRLLTIASVLGIVQGLAWLVMSLICIIMHLDTSTRPDINTLLNGSYMDIYKYNLYYGFLDAETTSRFIITPEAFTIFMWIYFISNTIWVILSVLLARTINKIDGNLLNTLKCWCVITCLISFIDLLLVILLGVDFNDCITNTYYDDEYFPRYEVERNCTDFLIPVLIIAAKGFLLWIINIIFAYVIYRIIRTIQSGKILNLKLLSTDRQLPRATLQGQPSSSNLYNQYQGGGYIQPSEHSWTNVPQRQSGYDPNRSAPSSPYYANPQQPSFPRY